MTHSPFHRLAPFLQEYIYTHHWTEFRQVQIAACDAIFETNAHLLLAAGTASGKTEAAFLPILTLLSETPSTTVGVLYISPIKALINDQFERLSDILKQTEMQVWAWHGDVSASHKKRLLRQPQGILQITPESLESLLLNKQKEIPRLFQDLRFIILDEIHAFMGSERGSQILCQLARISQITSNIPRRIGLSATLGDYTLAKQWLQSGTSLPVIVPEIEKGGQSVRLAVEHFYTGEGEDNPYYAYIYENSKASKSLIFTNNRAQSESIIANLRTLAYTEGQPDIYHVHHGSISTTLREDAETAMREDSPAVTAATVTLEMGIDLGQLERVIQINAPITVSSFLQRLGRSGRRNSPADMRLVCTEVASVDDFFPSRIPWDLLQCIAIIQLYLEERWIEPIEPQRYPYSLLYHQTMSILAARGELSPAMLAEAVLTLPAFTAISKDDFRQLLQYLITIEHLQKTEKGNLILGVTGEKFVRNFRFYAVFSGTTEYKVRNEVGEIGTIAILPTLGTQFALAGRSWEVIDIEEKRNIVFVKPIKGSFSSFWRGRGEGNVHSKVLQRMRQVLCEDTEYPYLLKGAKKRLQTARQLAKVEGLGESPLIEIDEKTCCIFPYLGTTAFRTLERYLNLFVREWLDIRSVKSQSPYFFVIKPGKEQFSELYDAIIEFCNKDLTEEDLIDTVEAPKLHKYDEFIPANLLKKGFAKDYLNVAEVREELKNW